MSVKTISVAEFRKQGYLQEVNRLLLHRLGLALSVKIDDDGNESFGDVLDCRNNDVGIIYDLENAPQDRLDRFRENANNIQSQLEAKDKVRIEKFGYDIEPINNSPAQPSIT